MVEMYYGRTRLSSSQREGNRGEDTPSPATYPAANPSATKELSKSESKPKEMNTRIEGEGRHTTLCHMGEMMKVGQYSQELGRVVTMPTERHSSIRLDGLKERLLKTAQYQKDVTYTT